jgi:hypothetical protein
MGLIGPGPLVNQYVTQTSGLDWSRLFVLGLISTEYAVWLTRQPQSWLEVGARRYSVTSSAAPPTVLGVPAHLLGLNFQPVLGYEGTSESWLALLRGEIDVMTTSDQSARRTLAAGRQAVVSLTLTQTPHPDFPGVPHLAGRGGLVDLRTRDMAPARRKELMEQAALAVTLSEQARMLLTSSRLAASLQTCLRHASEAALFDPAFAEAAKRQKLALEPEPLRPGWQCCNNPSSSTRSSCGPSPRLGPERTDPCGRHSSKPQNTGDCQAPPWGVGSRRCKCS